jgi:hypothetical protein
MRDRADRDLDDRRRGGDLRPDEPQRLGKRLDALLEIGGRVSGVVPCPREPEQDLRRRLHGRDADVVRDQRL